MIQLTLYTTLGCHLCQQLEGLLGQLCRESVVLERVEISEDEGLMVRYGVRIPVLADASGSELDRGFEPARLAAWLGERGWRDGDAWERLCRQLEGDDEPRVVRGAQWRGGRRYLG
ncbi:MAG: glutaredoxin family protein [Pseudomonadota bacterium]